MISEHRVRFGLLVLLGTVAAFFVWRGWDDFGGALGAAGSLLPVAVALVLVGLLGGARSWGALVPLNNRQVAFTAYLAAQPAKYLPVGGVAQALSQVGLSGRGPDVRRSLGLAWLVHGGVQVSAALALGVFALASVAVGTLARVLLGATALLGAGAVLYVVQPERVVWLRDRLGRILRIPPGDAVSPSARAILHSWAWTLVPLFCSGTAFALLLPGSINPGSLMGLVGSFSIAWAVGYLVFPLPSGAGARELVLVVMIDSVPAAGVLAVSVVHRGATLLAELVAVAVAGTIYRHGRRRGSTK